MKKYVMWQTDLKILLFNLNNTMGKKNKYKDLKDGF